MSLVFYFVAFVIAALVALGATPLVRRLALHVGMLDVVDERRMHEQPKPRIGGIAVYLGCSSALFATVGFALQVTKFFHQSDDIHTILGLLFGSTLILCIGVWDDIMTMRPRDKFLAQIAVALVSMAYGFIIPGFAAPLHHNNWIAIPIYFGVPITLFWYIGMMNAINFIDGLDGLLAGVTAIAGLSLFAISAAHGHDVEALILIALVGGAVGFLPHNFNPAKIFLGDSGALFIGYVFATVSIVTTSKVAVAISLIIPLIALGLPIADTAAAIIRRTLAGKSITDADRGHFHHVLVFRFGLPVRQAVLLIYAVTFVLGATAFLLSGGFAGRVHVGNLDIGKIMLAQHHK
jgi:UDP-GlcNAc:undecaprenyl-phosphate GlcNAc-1-phosphate transferase